MDDNVECMPRGIVTALLTERRRAPSAVHPLVLILKLPTSRIANSIIIYHASVSKSRDSRDYSVGKNKPISLAQFIRSIVKN